MAILFAFSITTQAEAIEYPSAKVQTAINQQSKIKITGTVVDQAGIPIIGANITVKNQTGTGTITDIDGRFTLEVPANSTLSISYIGYKNQEIRVTSSKPLTIKLQDDAEVLAFFRHQTSNPHTGFQIPDVPSESGHLPEAPQGRFCVHLFPVFYL